MIGADTAENERKSTETLTTFRDVIGGAKGMPYKADRDVRGRVRVEGRDPERSKICRYQHTTPPLGHTFRSEYVLASVSHFPFGSTTADSPQAANAVPKSAKESIDARENTSLSQT